MGPVAMNAEPVLFFAVPAARPFPVQACLPFAQDRAVALPAEVIGFAERNKLAVGQPQRVAICRDCGSRSTSRRAYGSGLFPGACRVFGAVCSRACPEWHWEQGKIPGENGGGGTKNFLLGVSGSAARMRMPQGDDQKRHRNHNSFFAGHGFRPLKRSGEGPRRQRSY